jgi:hypothetical protein
MNPTRTRGPIVGSLCGAAVLVSLAATAVGCGGATTAADRSVGDTTRPGQGSSGGLMEFGYIDSLKRKDAEFELRFDPAWFLSGVTANVAATEDGAVEPGQPVPNDNYVVDEGHRLLTYLVPETAHVTVLTRQGDPAQFGATPITVEQLAGILAGDNPLESSLYEPLSTGFWILVDIDTVRSLDQQYRP